MATGRPSASVPLAVARGLRRCATDQEKKLWRLLRERFRPMGHHLRWQVPIAEFVVDFRLPEGEIGDRDRRRRPCA
ncbi:MAG: DUF559 domain-containing protein [Hyphomicrobiales bacterium]|nr:DUF559 domain-containing protein [Hyphomicrobiales bacterium]